MKKLFPFVLLCLALLSLGLGACSDKDDNVPRIQLAYENPNEVFDNENPRISLRAFETADRVYPLYRERYPALEHAYHVQVVLEQYEGLTSEE